MLVPSLLVILLASPVLIKASEWVSSALDVAFTWSGEALTTPAGVREVTGV
jgi:hypothetical protein